MTSLRRATFEVTDVFTIAGIGVVVTGKVLEGTIELGMKAVISDKESEIRSIETFSHAVNSVSEGDNAALALTNIQKKDVTLGTLFFE